MGRTRATSRRYRKPQAFKIENGNQLKDEANWEIRGIVTPPTYPPGLILYLRKAISDMYHRRVRAYSIYTTTRLIQSSNAKTTIPEAKMYVGGDCSTHHERVMSYGTQHIDAEQSVPPEPRRRARISHTQGGNHDCAPVVRRDRKSTRLNSSH